MPYLALACRRLAGALALAGLAACGGTTEPTNAGFVRLVNATTDYPALDLYEGATALSGGVPPNAAGGYATREPGTYDFNLKAGGTNATAASTTQALQREQRHTLVAYTSAGTLSTAFWTESESAPSSGTAKLRIFHTAAADAGSVDVYLLDTPCSGLPASAAAPFARSVSGLQGGFGQTAAGSGGTPYHICVTSPGDKSDLRLDIPALRLADQQILTLILTRSAGGWLLNGLLLNQQGALVPTPNRSARVRLAAGTNPGSAVTAAANGVSLGQGYSAPAVGGYQRVDAGALALNVTVGATASTPAIATPAVAGGDYTLLLTGTESAPAVSLIADANTVSPSVARPVKLRLINGVNGATTRATLTYNFAPVGDAASGAASVPSLVAASAALARLEASLGGSPPVLLGTTLTLETGKVYTVFLLGTPAAPVAQLVADR